MGQNNSRLVWYILIALWALVLAAGGFWVRQTQSELATLGQRERTATERQAAQATDIAVIREQIRQITEAQARIEMGLYEVKRLLQGRGRGAEP